jgi:hypothetical protein
MNKELIDLAYITTMIDIACGVPLYEIEKEIKKEELKEEYEVCAGMLRALKKSKYISIRNLNKIIRDEH